MKLKLVGTLDETTGTYKFICDDCKCTVLEHELKEPFRCIKCECPGFTQDNFNPRKVKE